MPSRSQQIEQCLLRLAPKADPRDLAAILDHALHSKGLRKAAPDKAAWLSLESWLRHNASDYEDLLEQGYDMESARHFCRDQINAALDAWGCPKRL